MTIADIIRRGKGCAGSNGAWRVERDESDPFVGQDYSLWHYSTRMLRWRESVRHGVELIDCSTGHGSVSDQGGMNTAFRVLGLGYRYDRDRRGGGPRITELVRGEHGYWVDPRVRIEELRRSIQSSYEHGWTPERQLNELASIEEAT